MKLYNVIPCKIKNQRNKTFKIKILPNLYYNMMVASWYKFAEINICQVYIY